MELTFDQLQQIDTTQKRLNNLQTEISIAVKLLTETRLSTEQATKDNAYQQELLINVSSQVKTKQATATKFDEDILEKNSQLNKLNSEIADKELKQTAKEMELKDREDKISAKEKEINDKEVKILNAKDDLNNDIRNHKEKVAKLKDVISLF